MGLRGTNQEFGRPYNRRIVLETIRLHGPITRAQIAKHVGLTLQTISTITAELHEQGFLLLRQGAPKGRGFPAPFLEIDPEGGFAIGLHLTPRGLEAGLVNIAGEVIGRERFERPRMPPDLAYAEIARLTRKLKALRPDGRMLGVGLALPGPFDIESMSFVGPTTMEGWRGVPMLERLAMAVGHPVFIEADIAAAAHGERLYGLGSRFRDFYYLYFGVGLGGCLIHDGQVARGAWGNAGEIGHIPLVANGDPCPCGNRGCLERHLSLDAFERRGIGEDAWVAEVAPILRSAVITIENLFDPECIVMGGIAPPRLMDKLVAASAPLPGSVAARRDRTSPRLIRSSIGADAVPRGAAALAVTNALSPRFGLMFRQPGESDESDPIMRATARKQTA